MKDCLKCQVWDDCNGHWYSIRNHRNEKVLIEWYSILEIRFCKYQVKWILSYLGELKGEQGKEAQRDMKEGTWPISPVGSTWIEQPINSPRRIKNAAFEKPCEIAGEVELRLRKTGKDGLALLSVYCYGVPIGELAEYNHISKDEVERRMDSSLYYVSGWRRKIYRYRRPPKIW